MTASNIRPFIFQNPLSTNNYNEFIALHPSASSEKLMISCRNSRGSWAINSSRFILPDTKKRQRRSNRISIQFNSRWCSARSAFVRTVGGEQWRVCMLRVENPYLGLTWPGPALGLEPRPNPTQFCKKLIFVMKFFRKFWKMCVENWNIGSDRGFNPKLWVFGCPMQDVALHTWKNRTDFSFNRFQYIFIHSNPFQLFQ